MEVLYFLEKIRVPIVNELMLAITTLGEETAFLVIALVVFWCVDKRRGYYLLTVGFLGTIFSQFLKLFCRVPRPWVKDSNFTILEQAREAAAGYSFPSGHTQSAVGIFGSLAYTEKRKWLRIVLIVLAALVGFSRMYIGVHTPADVIVGAAISVALIIIIRPLVLNEGRGLPVLIGIMTAISCVYLAYVELYPFPVDTDPHNLESGLKNAYTLLGCIFGMNVIFYVEKNYINFPEKAVWWAQAIKVLGGLLLVLAVKEGLRAPLEGLLSGHLAARSIRYFLIVVVAGCVWPLTFAYFSKLGHCNCERKSCQEENHE